MSEHKVTQFDMRNWKNANLIRGTLSEKPSSSPYSIMCGSPFFLVASAMIRDGIVTHLQFKPRYAQSYLSVTDSGRAGGSPLRRPQ